MSASQIGNLRGIGPKSANAIKNCVQSFKQEVSQKEKLHLSPNNQTAKASELVKTLFQIDKLSEVGDLFHFSFSLFIFAT